MVVVIMQTVDRVSQLADYHVSALDTRGDRVDIEIRNGNQVVIIRLSRTEAIGLSAKLRTEIASYGDAENGEGYAVESDRSTPSRAVGSGTVTGIRGSQRPGDSHQKRADAGATGSGRGSRDTHAVYAQQ